MATWLFVTVAVLGVIAFVAIATGFGKDPTKKTDTQLDREYALHLKRIAGLMPGTNEYERAYAAMKVVRDEIERRNDRTETTTSIPIDRKLSGEQLRANARAAYYDGWARAKADGKDDELCHETALFNILFSAARNDFGSNSLPRPALEALQLETLPFNILPTDRGREALIEYAVWRENPDDADEEIVKGAMEEAVQRLTKEGHTDILAKLKRLPFRWGLLISPSSTKG